MGVGCVVCNLYGLGNYFYSITFFNGIGDLIIWVSNFFFISLPKLKILI